MEVVVLFFGIKMKEKEMMRSFNLNNRKAKEELGRQQNNYFI